MGNARGTRDQLLELFEKNKGSYFSGEEIAEKLGISRTAVWKAVQSLKNEGYKIEAVRNKGYSLATDTDILSAQGIEKYLRDAVGVGDEAGAGRNGNAKVTLNVLSEVDSTNVVAREKATAGAPDGYTVVAGSQTKGRGRMGRAFYSPAGTGVYMSLVLRPKNFSPQNAVKLTTMAAVAVCRAIEKVSGEKAEIKWVNDVYVRGKKVCGILTEASFNLEDGSLEYAVLGIGINVFPPKGGFPEDVKSVAGAVFREAESDGKNRLTAEFLNSFMEIYNKFSQNGDESYVDDYRNRSFVIGMDVKVVNGEESRNATVLDVDHDCRLVVEFEDGLRESLYSGEISLRVPGVHYDEQLSKLTDSIISGSRLTRNDDLSILLKADLEELCNGADEIRKKFCGNKADLCTIVNGMSGRCSEDCKFCAQSCHYKTGAQEYGFISTEEILEHAKRNEAAGVHRYSIVTSGRSLKGEALESALIAYETLRKETGLKLCASHGLQTVEEFKRMKAAGVDRCHCNIETSKRYFPQVCTTHTYEEKLENILHAQEAGLQVCSGGIIGMGETWEDRIEMALSLAELGVDSIPLNILQPIAGTPFEGLRPISDEDILRTVAIFRYLNPTALVRIAAGRKRFPGGGKILFRSGANSAITGDMLTTTGTGIAEDVRMMKKLGYEI